MVDQEDTSKFLRLKKDNAGIVMNYNVLIDEAVIK